VVPTDALVALEIGAEQLVLGGVHPEARAAIVAAANG
jgi:hypothetical protein